MHPLRRGLPKVGHCLLIHSMRRPAQKRTALAVLESVAAGAGAERDAAAEEPLAGPAGPVHPGRHGRKRSLAELQGTADGLRSGRGKGALAGTLHQTPQHVRKPFMVSCRTHCRFKSPSDQGSCRRTTIPFSNNSTAGAGTQARVGSCTSILSLTIAVSML